MSTFVEDLLKKPRVRILCDLECTRPKYFCIAKKYRKFEILFFSYSFARFSMGDWWNQLDISVVVYRKCDMKKRSCVKNQDFHMKKTKL